MRKRQRRQILSYILCLAILMGSFMPINVVHAEELSAGTPTPIPTSTSGPTDAPEEEEEPVLTPTPEEEEEEEVPTLTPTPEEEEVPTLTPTPGEEEEEEVPTLTPTPEEEVPTLTPTPEAAETPTIIPTLSPATSVSPSASPTTFVSPTPSSTPSSTPSPTPMASVKDLDYILGRPMTEEEKEQQREMVPILPVMPEEEVVEDYNSGISFFALDETYDSRDYNYITDVKNQSPYGICWSYATMASMESSLVMAGEADVSEIDLSEWHLAYFATHSGSDELGNTEGDYVKPLSGTGYMDNGGNTQMSIVALSNWKGAATENDYPGNTDREELQAAGEAMTPEDAWQHPAAYMKNCYMVPSSDREGIKTLIQAFGAVYASYNHADKYYNEDTAAYYSKLTGTNHAITIVGWDDTYSKENFTLTPTDNGAWICKNSWGNGWGKEGYFYISYEDTSLSSGNVAAFEGEKADENLNNYYYGGGVDIATYIYSTGIAQCYTAKGNAQGAEEIIRAGFFTYDADVSYQVQIYKNPTMKNGIVENPQSGEAVFETPFEGTTTYAGYHTIEWEEPVFIEEGTVFSVVISFDENIRILADATNSLKAGSLVIYDSVNATAKGESFTRPEGYGQYTSLYGENGKSYTPRMNIITQDAELPEYFILYRTNQGQKEKIGGFYKWQSVVDAIQNIGDTKASYHVEIVENGLFAKDFVIPSELESLTVSGPLSQEEEEIDENDLYTLKIADEDGKIAVNTNLTLQNISLALENSVEKISAITLQIQDKELTINGLVKGDRPLNFIGKNKGNDILRISGKLFVTGYGEGLAGSISGFSKVFFEEELRLLSYQTDVSANVGGSLTANTVEQSANVAIQGGLFADEYLIKEGLTLEIGQEDNAAEAVIRNYRALAGSSCTVFGKMTSAEKIGLYGSAENGIQLKAQQITANDITMSHAQIEAKTNFVIGGVLVSEAADNKLITRQKADKNGILADVYLNVNGKVILSEENEPVIVRVKSLQDTDAFLGNAPTVYGLLLRAKNAPAHYFTADEGNCGGEDIRTLKKGTGVYVYYVEEAPVAVTKEKDEEESFVGYYVTFGEAVNAVNVIKDKKASYVFSISSSLGENSVEKFVMPTYASDVTIKKAEEVSEEIVLHMADDLALKSKTCFNNVTFSPETSNGILNIKMGKNSLILDGITLADGKKVGKITGDTKAKQTLEIGENTGFFVDGSVTAAELKLNAGAELEIGGAGSVIGSVFYVPDTSKITIKSNADLTINNSVAPQYGEGKLCIEKDGAKEVTNLSEISKENRVVTLKKAPASAIKITGVNIGEGATYFKHDSHLYAAFANGVEADAQLLKVQLVRLDKAESSYFVDWYQAVNEITALSQTDASYQIKLLADIEQTRRLDKSGGFIKEAGKLNLPLAGKYTSLSVCGEGYSITYIGNLAIAGNCSFRDITFRKGNNDASDVIMSVDKKKNSRLVLHNCVGTFRNIKGNSSYSDIHFCGNTNIQVRGSATKLRGFYVGMDEALGILAGAEVIIGGKLEAKNLGIAGSEENVYEDTKLIVFGQLAVNTLDGEKGILAVRQKSRTDEKTMAKISGVSMRKKDMPLTVLVMKPEVAGAEVYEQALVSGKNPFVEDMADIPLLQATVMSAECVRTAKVIADENGISLQNLEGVVCYKDGNQYIRTCQKEEMRIRITATNKAGIASVSYAASWYEAIQDLNRMANNYSYYHLEFLENEVYQTGYNKTQKTALLGKLLLPSKVKGTVEVSCDNGILASLVYTGELKVPNGMTLIINQVPFEQVDKSGNPVREVITVGSGGTLELQGVTSSCSDIAKISAPKGSLVLDDTEVAVTEKTDINNLFVSDKVNRIAGKGLLQLQFVYPKKGAETGEIFLDTVSTYKKKKGNYQLAQLSQLVIKGAVAEGVTIRLHVRKDENKIPEGASVDYTSEELLVREGGKLTVSNRLATVAGNAADGRIILTDTEGNALSDSTNAYLMTEMGGLYLVEDEPIIRVVSTGGSTDAYLGYFRNMDAALNAISTSIKKDISISRKNTKEYQIIFCKQPQVPMNCKIPSNITKLVITQEVDEGKMPLTITGNLAFSKSAGSIEWKNIMVTVKGKVSVSNLILQNASVETVADVSIKNLTMDKASITGKNITVSNLAKMKEGQLYAQADSDYRTGKLKLNQLIATDIDTNMQNVLAAKVDRNGNAQITISGQVFARKERSAIEAPFVLHLYQNQNPLEPARIFADTKLMNAKKADADFFVLASENTETAKVQGEAADGGIYKKGTNLYYGDLSIRKALLIDESENADADGALLKGSSTRFDSIQGAIAEINSRNNKKASYRIVLLQDTEVKDNKGAFAGLSLPSKAKEVVIAGKLNAEDESEAPKELLYLGKLIPKCNITFENIRLTGYKKSGKNYVTGTEAVNGGNYQVSFAGDVNVTGSMNVKKLFLKDAARLYISQTLTTATITYGTDATIAIEKNYPIAISGGLVAKNAGENLRITVCVEQIPSGTKIFKIKSFFKKVVLRSMILSDLNDNNGYSIYQDGKSIYVRK